MRQKRETPGDAETIALRRAAALRLADESLRRSAPTPFVLEAIRPLTAGDEARLRWLIEWSAVDLARVPEQERIASRMRVLYLVTESWRVAAPFRLAEDMFRPLEPNSRRQLLRLQATLRGHLAQLAAGEQIAIPLRGRWKFSLRRVPGEPVTVDHHFDGAIPARLLLLATRLLERVGAWKLMACPYRRLESDARCGRLFLATRRQKFCDVKHSRAAAWDAWWSRRGGTRAKEGGRGQNVPANVPASTRKGTRAALRQPTRRENLSR